MGSQPIRIQHGKILWDILVGKSCGKFLSENLAGKSCRKFLQEILAGNSCGTRRRAKSQFKKGSDWWKFSIWNRVMGSQPIRIQLGKILQEKSCGKILWENLAGNSCGKILWEILREIVAGKSCGKCCGKFPIPISKPFLKVIFKICNSSRSTSFSLVNVKNSSLKPILDQFSHMTNQIEA